MCRLHGSWVPRIQLGGQPIQGGFSALEPMNQASRDLPSGNVGTAHGPQRALCYALGKSTGFAVRQPEARPPFLPLPGGDLGPVTHSVFCFFFSIFDVSSCITMTLDFSLGNATVFKTAKTMTILYNP